MDIDADIREWLSVLEQTKSPNTARAYKNASNSFRSYLESIDSTEWSPQLFVNYVPWLSSRDDLRTQSRRLYFSAVRSLYNWLVILDKMTATYNDERKLQMMTKNFSGKRQQSLSKTPSTDAVERIIALARSSIASRPIKERNIALLECLRSTGCRISELLALRFSDIQDRRAVVLGKGSKERYVFFDENATSSLAEYRKARRVEGWLFLRHDRGKNGDARPMTATSARNIVSNLAAELHLDNFSPHSFRHDFAVHALQKTGNLALVQDLLGHASPAATRHYAKISVDDLADGHKIIFGK